MYIIYTTLWNKFYKGSEIEKCVVIRSYENVFIMLNSLTINFTILSIIIIITTNPLYGVVDLITDVTTNKVSEFKSVSTVLEITIPCSHLSLSLFFGSSFLHHVMTECETAQDVTAPGMQSSGRPLPALINNY